MRASVIFFFYSFYILSKNFEGERWIFSSHISQNLFLFVSLIKIYIYIHGNFTVFVCLNKKKTGFVFVVVFISCDLYNSINFLMCKFLNTIQSVKHKERIGQGDMSPALLAKCLKHLDLWQCSLF